MSERMVIDRIKKNEIIRKSEAYLEENSLEDFLEEFDLSASEVILFLYEEGLLDPDVFDEITIV